MTFTPLTGKRGISVNQNKFSNYFHHQGRTKEKSLVWDELPRSEGRPSCRSFADRSEGREL